MIRDMELIRNMLIVSSKSDKKIDANTFVDSLNDLNKVAFNIELAKDAGLLKANISKIDDDNYFMAEIISLTWAGYDFVSSILDESVWKKVKEKLLKVSGQATISIIKKLAEKTLTEMIIGGVN